MDAKIGDRIIVETERVGSPDRTGEIVEVIVSSTGVHYRVHWDDGRESSFWPAAGSARIVPRAAPGHEPGPTATETRETATAGARG